jgi:hypothetical protein
MRPNVPGSSRPEIVVGTVLMNRRQSDIPESYSFNCADILSTECLKCSPIRATLVHGNYLALAVPFTFSK